LNEKRVKKRLHQKIRNLLVVRIVGCKILIGIGEMKNMVAISVETV